MGADDRVARDRPAPEVVTVAGSGHPALARAVAHRLGTAPVMATGSFPDGEVHVDVGDVRGRDVYIVQPTGPPVNDHVVELLLLADACRRGFAARVTAVVPYFGYARHDRRRHGGEAIACRTVADALVTAGVERLVVVDPHPPSFEAITAIPVRQLSAVPVLAEAVRADIPADAVVVAPDLGAAKLAERYGAILGLPVAVVRKHRLSGSEVTAGAIAGDVSGRPVVLVDDMITTGGTIEAACHATEAAGALPGAVVVASHGLFVGPAAERLAGSRVRRLVVGGTVPFPPDPRLDVEIVEVTSVVAGAIARLSAR